MKDRRLAAGFEESQPILEGFASPTSGNRQLY